MKKKFILLFLSLVISKSFGQNSIEVSKTGNAGSFANYLLNMDKSTDPTITRDVIVKKMEQFNKNSTGVKVMFSDHYMQKGGLQLQVEYKGKQEGYIPFEKVDE